MDNQKHEEPWEGEGSHALTDPNRLPIQLSFMEPDPVVRPEYNVGKFAGIIFTSPYAKNLDRPRVHQWVIPIAEGRNLNASLTITPQYGNQTPTTTTLRVYLGLVQIWTNSGRPEDGVVNFSARQLATIIGWKWNGTLTAQRIAKHISILKSTGLTWQWSYRRPEGDTEQLMSDVSILSSTRYLKRELLEKEQLYVASQRVRFNPDLVDNMLKGHVRPMNYEALRAIPNDTTLNLYALLDLYLTRKPRWERRSLELLRDELKLEGKRWEKRNIRHAKLKELVKGLDGVELFNGKLKLWIEPTADGVDHKLVATRVPRKEPRNQSTLKPVTEKAEAEAIAEDVIATLTSLPHGGHPRPEYIKYLCRMYPTSLIYRALGNAKVDYRDKVEKSVTHVFVYELRELVRAASGLTWHNDLKRQQETKAEGASQPPAEGRT
jgi:hypothetical protein